MQAILPILIWRDNVCAGDDSDDPHELMLNVSRDFSLRDFVKTCLTRHYLASIDGGSATWLLEASRPLAVVAQQWLEPRFLVPPESPIDTLIDLNAWPQLIFRYYRQFDPEQVLTRLLRGEEWHLL